MSSKKNIALFDAFSQIKTDIHNMAIFNISSMKCQEMEQVRKLARQNQAQLKVVKNKIFERSLGKIPGVHKKLAGNIMISYANNPASCVSFISLIKTKALREKINPICVVNNTTSEQVNTNIKTLINMRNENGIKIALIMTLKAQPISLIKILTLIKK